jgi:hypothetical protein
LHDKTWKAPRQISPKSRFIVAHKHCHHTRKLRGDQHAAQTRLREMTLQRLSCVGRIAARARASTLACPGGGADLCHKGCGTV